MPNFRHRLRPKQQRIYDKSNSIVTVPLRASDRLRKAVRLLPDILLSGERPKVQKLSQIIVDEICKGLKVATVTVTVQRTRPSNQQGELHGLYTATSKPNSAEIKVWMITAKRGQVVAFKTYLRTLLHEVCHHLDYACFSLKDSFHTEAFYKRESSLFYRIGGKLAAAATVQKKRSEKTE